MNEVFAIFAVVLMLAVAIAIPVVAMKLGRRLFGFLSVSNDLDALEAELALEEQTGVSVASDGTGVAQPENPAAGGTGLGWFRPGRLWLTFGLLNLALYIGIMLPWFGFVPIPGVTDSAWLNRTAELHSYLGERFLQTPFMTDLQFTQWFIPYKDKGIGPALELATSLQGFVIGLGLDVLLIVLGVLAPRGAIRSFRSECVLAVAMGLVFLIPAGAMFQWMFGGRDAAGADEFTAVEPMLDAPAETREDPRDEPAVQPQLLVPPVNPDPTPTGSSVVERRERGVLERADYLTAVGKNVDQYEFDGVAGNQVQIDVRSPRFDPFLMLMSPNGAQAWENDDHEGDETHSRIVATLPVTGKYSVFVTSFEAGETGEYELVIGPAERHHEGRLADGDGRLNTGEFRHVFTFEGSAGSEVEINLNSDEFDPFLILASPSSEQWNNDDFEGSPQHSRLSLILPESGTYTVIVTSYEPGETGAYELRARGAELTRAGPGSGL